MRPQAHEFPAEGQHRASVGPMITSDKIETRRLTGTVWSDQSEGFALVDREADVLHGAQSTKPPAEVTDDQRLSHRAALLLRELCQREQRDHTHRSGCR